MLTRVRELAASARGHLDVADAPPGDRRHEARVVALRVVGEIGADDCVTYAAGCAFKVFLSFFPTLVAVLSVYGLVRDPDDVAPLIDLVTDAVPGDSGEVLGRSLERLTEVSDGVALTALASGVVVGLVSSSGAAATLIRALNAAYDVEDRRAFLRQRLVGLGIVGALLGAFAVVVLTVVAGPQVLDLLVPESWENTALDVASATVQAALALLVIVTLVDLVYWAGPYRHRRWDWLSPGAVVAVAGWLLASGGFRVYAQSLGDYDATYGAVGGVAVVLLWLQLSVLSLLVGAELDEELRKRRLEVAEARAAGGSVRAASAVVPSGSLAGADHDDRPT